MSTTDPDDGVTFTPPPVTLPSLAERPVYEEGQLPSSFKTYPVVDGIPICETCNEQHVTLRGDPSCVRHNSAKRPCRAHPRHGTVLCRKHGGSAPQIQKKAKERIAEEEARKTLADVDIYPLGNAVDELAALTAEVLAGKDHFADLIAQLSELRYRDDKGGEQLRSEVELYERALDRAEKFLSTLVRIGFEEKRIALEEARAHQVTLFIMAVAVRLGFALEDPKVQAAIQECSPILLGEEIIDAEVVEDDG